MTESILAFVMWVLIGFIFIVLGIYDMCSKKEIPFRFHCNLCNSH